MPRFAVVGHVEWIEFGRFAHVPSPGEIIDARAWFSDAAGSAAVVAVQLARLGGEVDFFTALGSDWRGERSLARLRSLGVRVHAAARSEPQRWGFVHLTDDGERTISIVGRRLVPHGADALPWERIAGADAAFVSGGDAAALDFARRARLLVATPRAGDALAGVHVDVLVGSGADRLERLDAAPRSAPAAPHPATPRSAPTGGAAPHPATPRSAPTSAAAPRSAPTSAAAPRSAPTSAAAPHPAGAAERGTLLVITAGGDGGTWREGEASGRFAAAELPGPFVDPYGAGDTFAAGLTFALGTGMDRDAALAFAARTAAASLTVNGPYLG